MLGCNRDAIAEKVVPILKERRARNRTVSGDKYKKRSRAANRVLAKGAYSISQHWFYRFYGFWHSEIGEKTAQTDKETSCEVH